MSEAAPLLGVLRIARFRRLYIAHAVSLFGDALTWVGLALLAYQLAGDEASVILGSALTLRVVAYVVIAPWAGTLADRIDRRAIMVASDLVRMLVVVGFVLASEVWQVYALMFLLNLFTALFRPAFESSIPETAGKEAAPRAIALASATTEIFGVFGPGIAGGIAALLGTRWLFAIDATSFLLSALVLFTLRLTSERAAAEPTTWLRDTVEGSRLLWRPPALRVALGLELAAAISGAVILVDTVLFVRGVLGLGESEYGWVMMGFGLGATLAALVFPRLRRWRIGLMFSGAAMSALALLPVAMTGWVGVAALWIVAGAGQNWVNIGAQTLIAESFEQSVLGRVYGAHFAWSHLWWVGAYPIAGWLGANFAADAFPYGGLIAAVLTLLIVTLSLISRSRAIQ
jgi:MFS transporter, NRE family, putaive nickel resistance protein